MLRKVGKEWLRNRKKGICLFWNVKYYDGCKLLFPHCWEAKCCDSCHSFLLLKVSKEKLLANWERMATIAIAIVGRSITFERAITKRSKERIPKFKQNCWSLKIILYGSK